MRKPYCNPKVPTVAIDRRLGRTHVATPPSEVEAMIRRAIEAQRQPGRPDAEHWTDALAEQTVRYALWRHSANLEAYVAVMGGRGGAS